jgi:hypothetical protein
MGSHTSCANCMVAPKCNQGFSNSKPIFEVLTDLPFLANRPRSGRRQKVSAALGDALALPYAFGPIRNWRLWFIKADDRDRPEPT